MASTMRYESLDPTAGLGTQGVDAGAVLAGDRDLPGGAARALVDGVWASDGQGCEKGDKGKADGKPAKLCRTAPEGEGHLNNAMN